MVAWFPPTGEGGESSTVKVGFTLPQVLTPGLPASFFSFKNMGLYRKVEIRTWGDEKFRRLTPLQPSGQALWLFLIAGPFTGPIPGLFRAGPGAMAEELGWNAEAFRLAISEAIALGMVEADLEARVVWIPNAIKHNPPGSLNVVKSWRSEWELIPECDLKRRAYEILKASVSAVGEGFADAFDHAITKPSPKPKPLARAIQEQKQEQEQEQKQKQEQEGSKDSCAALSDDIATPPPDEPVFITIPIINGSEHSITESEVAEYRQLYPAVNVEQALRDCRGWNLANRKQRKTPTGIRRHINTWLSKEQNRGGSAKRIQPVDNDPIAEAKARRAARGADCG